MPFKVLFLHSELPDDAASLGSFGSFLHDQIPPECSLYVEELSRDGDFEIYFSNSSENHSFAALSFDELTSGTINIRNSHPSPKWVRDQLTLQRKDLEHRRLPKDEPFVPEWIDNVLNNCYVHPSPTGVACDQLCFDESLLEQANSHTFSTFSRCHQELCCFVFSILTQFTKPLRLDEQKLQTFIAFVYSSYRANSYHNFQHGVDVMQSIWYFTRLAEFDFKLRPLEHFALLVAALAHDVGHFGFKNKFVIDSGHPLSIIYNDRSPVENYHCLILFSILRLPECQFGCNWDVTMRREFRRISMSVILATDMVFHSEYVRKFQSVQPTSCVSPRLPPIHDLPDQRLLTMIMLIKAADLCNVIRPFDVAEQWGACLQTEFYHQVFFCCPFNNDRVIGRSIWGSNVLSTMIAPRTTFLQARCDS